MENTTAPALVAEEAMPDQVADTEATEENEDAAYDAVFDRMNPDDEDAEQEEAPEKEAAEGDDDQEAADPAEQTEAAPSDLPAALRDSWGKIPKDARDAVLHSQREMSRKLADQGRLVQGLGPIKGAMERAVQEIPGLENLTPDQIAGSIYQLAQIDHQFKMNPVETLMGLADKHNMRDQLAQALGTQAAPQQQNNALLQEIQTLKQTIQQISDPNHTRQSFETMMAERTVTDEVSNFASTADHWADVEAHIPDFIPAVQRKLGDSASPKDVLSAAYDLALNFYMPDAKAKQQARSDQDRQAADPKTQAALKAKSANITSTTNGKQRELTEEEALSAVYDRAVKA